MSSQVAVLGRYLLFSGSGLIFLGFLMMLDGPLMALGNIQFVIGLIMNIGINNLVNTFLQWKRIPFSLLLFSGFTLVLVRFPITGLIMQVIALLFLFWSFVQTWIGYLKSVAVFIPSLKSD